VRRPRKFRSKLAGSLTSYLAVKRALGYKLVSDERILRYLDSFLVAHFPSATDLSAPILEDWMRGIAPLTRLVRLGMVRKLGLFRRRLDPDAFVPDRVTCPSLWPVRANPHVPFIFTKEQIRRLLRAARASGSNPVTRQRSRVLSLFVLLLYTAGLRLGEAARLTVGDIDLDQGSLLIRDTKFFKSRIVPISPDVLSQVRRHVTLALGPHAWRSPNQRIFQHRGRPYSSHTLGILGAELIRRCGLKPAHGRGGARIHDLRHTFAVHRITAWYADGEDVQSRLPLLATYMGHKDIACTQRYMSVTAEILDYANQRFERACAPRGRR
jgi:integrase/recombinase XerD